MSSNLEVSQVHISLSDDESSMVVHWGVNILVKALTVKYSPHSTGLDSSSLSSPSSCKGFFNTRLDPLSIPHYVCHSTLPNLLSNTYYDYTIGSDSLGWSKVYTLRSKRHADSARFIVYGDFGVGEQTNLTVAAIKTAMDKDEFDGVLHVGDIAYDLDSDNGKTGDDFLNSIEEIASGLPYMVSQGNHENKKNEHHYKYRFTMPGNSSNLWYSFDYGKAHFIGYTQEMMFTNNYEKDEGRLKRMMDFLWSDLIKVDRARHPWLIVYTHRPFYCSLSFSDPGTPYYEENTVQENLEHTNHINDCTIAAGNIRKQFEDLWFDFKVDLVITAHVHLYERLHPTYKSEYIACNVTTENYCQGAKAPLYIVAGVPGNQESYAFGSEERFVTSVFQTSHLGFGKLEVIGENHLRWEQISSDTAEIIDYLDLYK